MEFGFLFFLNSILFGVGLAMDAFSVSLADGLNEPAMDRRKSCLIAGTFALFQTLMPLAGWFLVRTAERLFSVIQRFIPWTALILLLYIGGKMLLEGITALRRRKRRQAADVQTEGTREGKKVLLIPALILQGIATSIDALSVGLTISEYDTAAAVTEALIIGLVTFFICLLGIRAGRKAGAYLADYASILGGSILILIGIEIFVSSFF